MKEIPIIFSQHVIETVKALSDEDRKAVADALVNEFVLGLNPDECLTPFQAMLYTLISHYVKRDSIRSAEFTKNVI